MANENRSFSWVRGFLLAVPLVVLAAWLIRGGVSRSFGPDPGAAPASGSSADSPAAFLADLPPPHGDFPAARMFERVNGAADSLIAAGCGRLLFWQVEDPAAEVELLVFDGEAGAASTLADDAGSIRTDAPGDEGVVSGEAIFFRRGRFYVRLLAEPGASIEPARLLDLAGRFDRSLQGADPAEEAAGGSP